MLTSAGMFDIIYWESGKHNREDYTTKKHIGHHDPYILMSKERALGLSKGVSVYKNRKT